MTAMLFRVLLLMLATASSVYAECDTQIRAGDKIGDVKRKLSCLAEENAVLKRGLRHVPGKLRIHRVSLKSTPQRTVQRCMSTAVATMASRKAVVVDTGSTWIDFEVGRFAVMLDCEDGHVIVAGTEYEEIVKLADELGLSLGG
jgi:hypothetical protein